MTNRTIHHWHTVRCTAATVTCYFILQENTVAHVSFSPASHAQGLALLHRHGIAVQPARQGSRLAGGIQAAFEKYLAGQPQLALPPCYDSPFWQTATPFQHKVWAEISRIPYGQTRTYGELASRLGNPHGARAVGQACHANPLALIIPCHRVVASQGLGGFAGGIEIKKRLLAVEQRQTGEKIRPTLRPF